MAMFGQLPDDFFKYKKSKTKLDGSFPGVPFNKFRHHLTPPLSSGSGKPAGYHHDLYLHGSPRDYRPNINAPSVDWNEYEAYQPLDMLHPQPSSEMRFHSLNPSIMPPNLISIPKDDMTLHEQFIQSMGVKTPVEAVTSDSLSVRVPNDFDDLPDIKDLANAFMQLSKVFPQDHPDILNLKNAMHQLSDASTIPLMKRAIVEIKNGDAFDPQFEAEKIYDQQMQFFEKSIKLAIPNQNENFSVLMPDIINTAGLPLEEIIEQEESIENPQMQFAGDSMTDNQDMAFGQIEQAIDQVIEHSLPQEPDQFYMQPDPFMEPEYMFDPQYMPNYMMPGQMPLGPMGMMQGPM